MTATTMPAQSDTVELPPPPYPPPLPIEAHKYSPDEAVAKPESSLVATNPGSLMKRSSASNIKKSVSTFTEKAKAHKPRKSEIFGNVRKFAGNAKAQVFKVYGGAAKTSLSWLKGKAPAAKSAFGSGKSVAQKQANGFMNFIQEESPVYSAFIGLGAAALILSLLLAPFVSPSVWIIIALAAIVQIIVGFRLKNQA